MLACVSGTILGRDVVPDVGSSSATSSALLTGSSDGTLSWFPVSAKRPASASAVVDSSMTRIPRESATRRAGESIPASVINARGLQISEISVQFLAFHRLGSTGRMPRSPPRRESPPPSPDHSAAPRRLGHDGLSPWPAARTPSCRCADKDGHRSAGRGPEQESPARREYAWPDVQAGGLGTKMELRALGVCDVRLACFAIRVGITA